MKIEIIRRTANKKQFKKNVFLGFLCLLIISGFLFFVLNPVLTKAQDLNNGLENFRNAANYANTDLPTAMGRIMKIVLGVLGLAAAVIIIAGGFKWMTSGGDEKKIAEAKKLMIAGIVGILIIVLAYAISSFIISKLVGVTGPPAPCVGSSCCTPGSCCGDGMIKDVNCNCVATLSDTCRLPLDSTSLLMRSGEADFDNSQQVFRCSKIKPVFNHNLSSSTAVTDLQVVKDSDKSIVNGNWQIKGNSVLFVPQTIWDANIKYDVVVPKSIRDTYNRLLNGCSTGFKPSGHCSSGDTVVWDFTTNNILDTEAPKITSTYPVNSGTKYPDKWVSRAPVIDSIFSENIDIDTVADADGHPISANFKIEKLTAQGGTVSETIDAGKLIIRDKSQGFLVSLTGGTLLDPFTWYKITIANVKDLCGNPMAAPQSWEFETNDIIPGVSDYWPKNKNVCPDEPIGVRFATSMYNNTITIQGKTGKIVVFQGFIKPFEGIEAPVTTEDGFSTIGKIKIIDTDIENISNQFKVFEITLNNSLTATATYSIDVKTDLVMDVDQNTLGKKWDFTTTDLTKCACSPVIYRVTPDSGSRENCVTVYGRCFTGTINRPATITNNKIQFNDNPSVVPARPNGEDGPTNADIKSSGSDFITTTIPAVFGNPITDIPDSLGVKVGITYEDNSSLETESWDQFTVNDNSASTGPCLWSINPNSGYPKGDPDETKVSLNGLRFGVKNNDSKIIFYNQLTADFSDTDWSDTQVREVLVPADTQTGDVVIKNSSGMSNGLPFKVLFRAPKPGDKCQNTISCPLNSGSCQTPYQCLSGTDTCRCCCDPTQNSCSVGLTCLANQGNCSGATRGLCCGCKNDTQCGNGAGCGVLDPNKCCHSKPIINIKLPASGATDVCKNTAISMTFNDLMDRGSLNENNIKLLSSNIDPGYVNDIKDGAVAIWHFDEGSGLTTKDSKGANNGTISGATWVDGQFGKALKFNGNATDKDDYLEISDNNLNITGELTAEAWIKPDFAATPGYYTILDKGVSGGTTTSQYDFTLLSASRKLEVFYGSVSGDCSFIDSNITVPNDGKFHHVAFTYNNKNGITFYVDGQKDYPTTYSYYSKCGDKNTYSSALNQPAKPLVSHSGTKFKIGRRAGYKEYYFQGIIDEVRVYSRALTDEEILAPHQIKGRIASADEGNETIVNFYPSGCQLKPNSIYKVWLRGGIDGSGIRSKMGVSINDTAWTFTTGNGTCNIQKIKVNPMNPAALNKLNQTTEFSASAIDSSGRPICVDKFDWVSANTGVAVISPSSGLSAIATSKGFGQSLIMASTGESTCWTGNDHTCAILKVSPEGLLKIIEQSGCDQCSLGGQSPSPASQSTNACTQAQIRVRFNREVVMDTTSATDNIIIQKCGTGDFNNSQCPSDNSNKVKGVFTIEKDGFYFKPTAALDKNIIYRVTLKSGPNGIKDTFGLELDGNKNGVQDGMPSDNYSWMFIATNDNCPLNKVCINPAGTTQIVKDETQNYFTQVYTSNCNYLNANNYTWSWAIQNKDLTLLTFSKTDSSKIGLTGLKLGETDVSANTKIGSDTFTDTAHLVVATQPTATNYPANASLNICRNTVISATFDQSMDDSDNSTLNSDTIKFYKSCPIVATSSEKNNLFVRFFNNLKNFFLKKTEAQKQVAEIWCPIKADISATNNTVYLNPGLLDAGKKYQVLIKGGDSGVKSKYGVGMAADNSWTFTTGAEICKLSKVEIKADSIVSGNAKIISNKSVEFYTKDSIINFNAVAYDNKGNKIQGTTGYSWTWSWDSSKPNVVLVPISNSPSQTATAQNQNGISQIEITAKVAVGGSESASDTAQAKVFLCENPWFYKDIDPKNTHFSIEYCRDRGRSTDTTDDLPQLNSIPKTGPGDLIKEFLFTNNVNNDVIGLKVFKNSDYLTPFEWYKKNVPNPGSPTSLVINGYQAVKEGRTVYVGATNLNGNNIEGLVYLISYSDNAEQETIDIFNLLIKNWQFNINETANQLKIQRDLFRLYDLKIMSQKLADYKSTNGYYPKLESGSFIKGMTVSKWPSWKNPQGQFISSMPNDPTNQFLNPISGYCAGCSDTGQCDGTCYNQSTSKYECSVGSSVYQYAAISEDDYRLYLNFETDSKKWLTNCGSYNLSSCETHYLCGWKNTCKSRLFYYNNQSEDIYKCFNSIYGPVIENTGNDHGAIEINIGGNIS